MVELIKVQPELDPDIKAFLRDVEAIKSQALGNASERLIQTKKNIDGTESIAIQLTEEDQVSDLYKASFRLVNDEEVKLSEQQFEDSTALDAFIGNLDKISATAVLFLGVMGVIDLEDAANISAAHSVRLHNAQKHAPEYMQEVMRALEGTEGILSTLAVLAKFPRTWPRMIFEQTVNAAIPVAMRLGGGIAGGFAIPVFGVFPGMLAGGFAGNAFQETIFWVDQIMQERGIDPTNAEQVLGFLMDRELMDRVGKEAARKGLSQAAVATIFDMFTGRILSGSGKTLSSKAIRFTGGTAVQTVGEGGEEAVGQIAARGSFSGKDVALEAALGLGGSVSNTAVISLFNQAIGKESFRKTKEETTGKKPEEIKKEEAIESKIITKEKKDDKEKEEVTKTKDTEALKEAAQVKRERDERFDRSVAVGNMLTDAEFKEFEKRFDEKIEETPLLNANAQVILMDNIAVDIILEREGMTRKKLEVLIQEAGPAPRFTAEDFKHLSEEGKVPVVESTAEEKSLRKKIVKRKEKLTPTLPKGLQGVKPRFGFGQKDLFSINFASDIDKALFIVAQDKPSKSDAKFMDFLKPFFPELSEKQLRGKGKAVKNEIKQQIADDKVDGDVVNLPETSFAKEGRVLEREIEEEVEVLDVTIGFTEEGERITEEVIVGKVETKKEKAERISKTTKKKIEDAHIKEIEADAVPFKVQGTTSIHAKEIAGGLTGNEEFNNAVAQAANGFKAKLLALTPMDVVFDLMSKVTGTFKGAVFTIFKKPLDIGQRNQTKHDLKIKTEYIDLRDKLDLNNDRSKGRIGVMGILTQEHGRERILAQLTEQLGAVKAEKILAKFEKEGLTEKEQTMLDFILSNFEKLKHPVLEVMRDAYGKDFRFVKDYFSFVADFKAMEDTEIQEKFGKDAILVELIQPDVRAKPPGKPQQGFTKERVGGELNIKIDAEEIFLKYVDNATYLIHMGRDIERLRKLAKRKEYKAAVGNLGGSITKNWLDLMARRGGAQGSRITKLDWLRKNVGVAILGFKLATVMIQTTAIFDGAVRLGPIAFKGVQNIILDPEWRAFIRDNFTEVQNRVGGDASIRELQDANFGNVINKLRDVSILGVRTVDGLVASGIAAAAYEKIVTEKGDKVDFANPDIDAIIEAELEVRLTQGSGLFKDVPAALSDGAFWGNASVDKAFFQFQTFVLSRWALVTTAFGGTDKWHEPTALKVRLVSFLTLALIAETGLRMGSQAIIAGVAGAISGDDPFERSLDTFIEDSFLEKLAINAIQTPPIIGSLVSTAIYGNAPVPVISLPVEAGRRFGFAWTAKTTDKKFLKLVQGVNLLAGILGVAPGAVQVDQLLRQIIKDDKKKSRRTQTRSR